MLHHTSSIYQSQLQCIALICFEITRTVTDLIDSINRRCWPPVFISLSQAEANNSDANTKFLTRWNTTPYLNDINGMYSLLKINKTKYTMLLGVMLSLLMSCNDTSDRKLWTGLKIWSKRYSEGIQYARKNRYKWCL